MNSRIVTLLVINYGSKRLNVNINIRNGCINLTDSFLILHLLKTKITMAFAHKYFVMFLLLSIVTQGNVIESLKAFCIYLRNFMRLVHICILNIQSSSWDNISIFFHIHIELQN